MTGLARGKTVLVTGGTGSIGSEIVMQLLESGPTAVRVFSRDETKQFDLQQEIGPRPDIRYLIGDVRDSERLRRAMEGVDIVFHAAAMKHVPASEYNPFEAVKTNVIGVQNVIEAALDREVERVVAISTDKVANPTNTMGATKLLAERLIAAANYYKGPRRTVFTCVRFGNVVGSRGSVVPLFERQIAAGLPVTITDRRMTRFMMTVQDAVSLVLQAAVCGRGGEVFILKMPVVRIVDLATAAIAVFGRRYGRQVSGYPVSVCGLRPGEKLHEELMTGEEAVRAVETDTMFIIQPSLQEGQNRHPSARRDPTLSYASDAVEPVSVDVVIEMLAAAGYTDQAAAGEVTSIDLKPARAGSYSGPQRIAGHSV